MHALLTQLRQCLRGRVCLVALGHPDKADDAVGWRLAEAVADRLSGTSAVPVGSRLVVEDRFEPPSGSHSPASTAMNRSADIPVGVMPAGKPALQGPQAQGAVDVWLVGTDLERHLHRLCAGNWDHVIFLDAADFGAEPGAVTLLDRTEMRARFPQCSTHRLSLGLAADMIEGRGPTRAWLLAVQPKSLRSGEPLSIEVRRAVEALSEWITGTGCAPCLAERPAVPEPA